MIDQILHELKLIKAALVLQNKEVLNLRDAAEYSGLSKSHIYQLLTRKEIPYSKPGGKTVFIRKSDFDKFLLSNPVLTDDQVDKFANSKTFKR